MYTIAVTMRRKPVTRSEVRFDGSRIWTLPADAVRVEKDDDLPWREDIVPIPKLWAPLLGALNRAGKRRHEEREQAIANMSIEDRALYANLRISTKPTSWEPIRLPDRYIYAQPRLCTCQHCNREFYRVSLNGRYCSDDCAKASWRDGRAGSVAAMVKARSEARAAARADRRCAHCNEPIKAQRSTNKFCSVRCRVATHREGKRDATA
jgi:hypothetical protein